MFALTPNVAASCATNPDDRRCHLSSSRRENSSADAATLCRRDIHSASLVETVAVQILVLVVPSYHMGEAV